MIPGVKLPEKGKNALFSYLSMKKAIKPPLYEDNQTYRELYDII